MSNFWTQPGSKDVYIYFSIIIILMIIYGVALYSIYGKDNIIDNEILNTEITKMEVFGNFGGWSISHIIVFYLAGFLFPEQWVLIFVLGVLWEFVEVVLGELFVKIMGKSENSGNRKVVYGDKWMDGNLNDIWYNTIGLFLGYLTIMTYKEYKSKKYRLPLNE